MLIACATPYWNRSQPISSLSYPFPIHSHRSRSSLSTDTTHRTTIVPFVSVLYAHETSHFVAFNFMTIPITNFIAFVCNFVVFVIVVVMSHHECGGKYPKNIVTTTNFPFFQCQSAIYIDCVLSLSFRKFSLTFFRRRPNSFSLFLSFCFVFPVAANTAAAIDLLSHRNLWKWERNRKLPFSASLLLPTHRITHAQRVELVQRFIFDRLLVVWVSRKEDSCVHTHYTLIYMPPKMRRMFMFIKYLP